MSIINLNIFVFIIECSDLWDCCRLLLNLVYKANVIAGNKGTLTLSFKFIYNIHLFVQMAIYILIKRGVQL